MLVAVTLLCVWLGWTFKVYHDGAETRRWVIERGLHIFSRNQIFALWSAGASHVVWKQRPQPLCMRLIGEEPMYAVRVPTDIELTPEEQRRIERDLPEAGFMAIGGY